MPKYLLEGNCYLNDTLRKQGEIIDFSGTPNKVMRPISIGARLRKWLWLEYLQWKGSSATKHFALASGHLFLELLYLSGFFIFSLRPKRLSLDKFVFEPPLQQSTTEELMEATFPVTKRATKRAKRWYE